MKHKLAIVSIEGDYDPMFIAGSPQNLLIGDPWRLLFYRDDIQSSIPQCPNACQREVFIRKKLHPVAWRMTGQISSSRVHSEAKANSALNASRESCG